MVVVVVEDCALWAQHLCAASRDTRHPAPPSPPQGTFGELPQPASDQLGVVRACAYHLLNMINQLRDCLRTLHEGDPELNAGRVQLSNAVEEVRGPGVRAFRT